MSDGIYVALCGALGQNSLLETTANNLANTSTDGYQRLRPVFHQVLSSVGGAASRRTSAVTVSSMAVDPEVGALRTTGRQMDAARPAGTYLAVTTPRGERYTRAASLVVDGHGAVRTAQGHVVLNELNQPLVLPQGITDVSLAVNGEIRSGTAVNGGMAPPVTLSRLKLVTFQDPTQLRNEGATLLTPNGAVPTLARDPVITVGSLEGSNATTVGAMTELVTATRTFEAFQRVIDTFRDADRQAVTSVPRP